MADKHTHTINLSNDEANVLSALAEQKGMSKNAVMRQALRMYQLIQKADFVDLRLGTERIYLTSDVGKAVL